MSVATVAFWYGEEGWGGIEAPDRPGVGFVSCMQVRIDGLRDLVLGEPVEYEWGDDNGQDGCDWRVAWVRPTDRT